jgi:hypothetical protein
MLANILFLNLIRYLIHMYILIILMGKQAEKQGMTFLQ